MSSSPLRIAIVDREARRRSAPEESRFLPLFRALSDLGAHVERAVYDEAFAHELRRQLMDVDGVLVWVNPLQDGPYALRFSVSPGEIAYGAI